MGLGLNGSSYIVTMVGDGLTNVLTHAVSAWWGGVSARLVGSAVGSPGPKSTVAHLGLQL